MSQTAFVRMPTAKRQALVFAAAEEFASHPFEQASLNRIIASCRMSKSSFYHVIESKESLLTLVVDRLRSDAALDWAPPSPADFTSDFWATAAHVFDDALRVWPHSRALELLWRIVHANRDDPAVSSLGTSFEAWVASTLQVGRDAGAIDSACPIELQCLAVATLLTAFDEWALRQTDDALRQTDDKDRPRGGGDLESAAAQQFRLLRRLLEA
ncbi:MAG: TetR/AcrR family transcriptional regulator [Brevibacterium sp.]|nr:TetR/AcrR family transcriptional regulator [Brevibacterium sp.]MDN6189050.1 TetR/AcrR family transcriptional regulator [Brevibacterium sp.]